MSDDLAVQPLHLLELCSGYGGIELALRSVGRVRTVCRVERDAYAAATLVARMVEQRLDNAPIWDCLETFDGAAWRGRVHIVAAGFPCQPFSAAGRRRGTDDDRWFWPEIARIIRDVGPRYVLLENVPELVRRGLPHVLDDLARLGFDVEWGVYPASAVGAPHRRSRVWIVAHHPGIERQPASTQPAVGRLRRDPRRRSDALASRPAERSGRRDVGHASCARRSEVAERSSSDEGANGGGRTKPTSLTVQAKLWPTPRASMQENRTTRNAPSHGNGHGLTLAGTASHHAEQTSTGGAAGKVLNPRFVEALMGIPRWLADALHLGGNGLVPQCAAEAWRQLYERLVRS